MTITSLLSVNPITFYNIPEIIDLILIFLLVLVIILCTIFFFLEFCEGRKKRGVKVNSIIETQCKKILDFWNWNVNQLMVVFLLGILVIFVIWFLHTSQLALPTWRKIIELAKVKNFILEELVRNLQKKQETPWWKRFF